MTTADHRPVLVDKNGSDDRPAHNLADLLATLTPFRTEARIGMNNVRFEDGILAGYTEPRRRPWSGAIHAVEDLETGMLVDAWYAKFSRDYVKEIVDYVVYSYDTIIAWHCKEHSYAKISNGINPSRWEKVPVRWEVTDTMITATTAKHQWRVVVALRQKGLL